MKMTIVVFITWTFLLASSAFADDIVGMHHLTEDQGLVRVKSVVGNKMALDIIYAPNKGSVILLTDVYADYDPQRQRAVYSEDRLCPDALKFTFQKNRRVVLREAACAAF